MITRDALESLFTSLKIGDVMEVAGEGHGRTIVYQGRVHSKTQYSDRGWQIDFRADDCRITWQQASKPGDEGHYRLSIRGIVADETIVQHARIL